MEKDFDTILNDAINQCNNESNGNIFPYIYPFSTENIDGFIDFFGLKDKSLLTVGSSCDQAINAYYSGCKDVTILDINEYTKYYYYLKVACILSLDTDEYMRYLRFINYPKVFYLNQLVFDIKLFKRISPALKSLNSEAYEFWYTLFSLFKRNTVRESLFSTDELTDSYLRKNNRYMESEDAYRNTRNSIIDVEPKFIIGDVTNIQLEDNYDNVWLSNIAVYLSLEQIISMVNNFDKNLLPYGKLLISYLYAYSKSEEYKWSARPIYYDLDKVKERLDKFKPEIREFDGASGPEKDAILVYKKVL